MLEIILIFLLKKYKFKIFPVNQWISLGDPFELKVYEYWKSYFEN